MKVCRSCAEELADDARVCTQCGRDPDERPEPVAHVPAVDPLARPFDPGAPPPRRDEPLPPVVPPLPRGPMNAIAVAALAVVLLSYPFGFAAPILALLLEAAGLVLGFLALQAIERSGRAERGREFAWVAIALGGIGIVGSLVGLAQGGSLLR
jgi:hypothetical protein